MTFFRRGVARNAAAKSAWDVRDLYLAHLALSDLEAGKFLHAQRTNRAGPGIAGINQADARIWNGNWAVTWRGDEQLLRAVDERFAFQFSLRSVKTPVIHGTAGVSQKAAGKGRASHYISLTRLEAQGTVQVGGKTFEVAGTAWMDHEFFTHQLDAEQVGWDWISIQLEDNTELMLFQIRRKDGSIDSHSAGTFVDAHANIRHLSANEFTLVAGERWTSPLTHAAYPIHWKLAIPTLGVTLECSTTLPTQEFESAGTVPAYWEGAVKFSGTKQGAPIKGQGYLEMTGYDHPVSGLN